MVLSRLEDEKGDRIEFVVIKPEEREEEDLSKQGERGRDPA